MTIDEAIEILTLDKTCDFEGNSKDLGDALQLGIEALKQLKLSRPTTYWAPEFALPGETKD